jgi:hypothetical protein
MTFTGNTGNAGKPSLLPEIQPTSSQAFARSSEQVAMPASTEDAGASSSAGNHCRRRLRFLCRRQLLTPANLPSLAFAENDVLGILITNVHSKRRQKILLTPSFPTLRTNAGNCIPRVCLVFHSAFWAPALCLFFVV